MWFHLVHDTSHNFFHMKALFFFLTLVLICSLASTTQTVPASSKKRDTNAISNALSEYALIIKSSHHIVLNSNIFVLITL